MTLAALSSLLAALLASAQEGTSSAGLGAETIAANPDRAARGFRFLIGAYTIVWTILAIYLFSLSIRLRSLSLQVRRLRDKLGI
jgi:CcmD family protein